MYFVSIIGDITLDLGISLFLFKANAIIRTCLPFEESISMLIESFQ